MNKKYLALILQVAICIMMSCSIGFAIAAEISIINAKVNIISNSPMSATDVYALLIKNNIKVNYEAGVNEQFKQTLSIPEGEIFVPALLDKLHEQFGYDFEEKDGVATIFDRNTRKLGDQYPLNNIITKVKFENVYPYDAIKIIGDQCNLFVYPDFNAMTEKAGKPISLVLENVTVRDALNQIVKAAGLSCWQASPIIAIKGPYKGRISAFIALH